jgi:hypothetical protein
MHIENHYDLNDSGSYLSINSNKKLNIIMEKNSDNLLGSVSKNLRNYKKFDDFLKDMEENRFKNKSNKLDDNNDNNINDIIIKNNNNIQSVLNSIKKLKTTNSEEKKLNENII